MAKIIVSSGETSSGLELSTDSMYISSGGTALHTVAYFSGYCAVYSGGVANNNTVSDGGKMEVNFGGKATGITVASSGSLYVGGGGIALEIRENGGMVDVYEGAKATFVPNSFSNLDLSSGRWATAHSGTTANSINISDKGRFNVFSGGMVRNTVVSSDGLLAVQSGGRASNTVVSSGGDFEIFSGGMANSTTVSNGGKMEVNSGVTASIVTVSSGGSLSVLEDAIANDVTIEKNGSLFVMGTVDGLTFAPGAGELYQPLYLNAQVNRLTLNSDCVLRIIQGGVTVNGATIHDGGELILQTGVANDVIISGGGEASLFAVMNNLTVYSGGIATVGDTGTLNSATILSGGSLQIKFGGTANDLQVTSGGKLDVSSGGTLSGVTVQSGGTALLRGGTISTSDFVVCGNLSIYQGAEVYGAQIKNGARVLLTYCSLSGATVTGGEVTLKTGAEIHDVTVSSGGVVTGILRKTQGLTFSGGTLDLNIAKSSENDGFHYLVDSISYADIRNGTYNVTLTVANKQLNGTYYLINAASGFNKTITVQNPVGYQLGTLTVGSGPKELLDGVTYDLQQVNGTSLAVVVTGGAVPDPIHSGDILVDERLDITSGMSAIDVTVSSGGILAVYSGGVASNTTVYDGGEFNVHSNGDLTGATIYSGGTATVGEDVMARDVVVDGGVFVLENGGWAYRTSKGSTVSSNTIVSNSGSAIVNEGGWLMGAEVLDGGIVEVMSDGTFDIGRVSNGLVSAYDGAHVSRMNLEEGGVLNVESGGSAQHINVSAGGVLTGVLRDASELRFYNGTLDLNIANAAPGSEVLVDEMSYGNITPLQNYTYNCTLTVGSYQSNGTYQLIEGAYEFDKSITVRNENGTTLGTLTVGGTTEIDGVTYALNLSNDYLLTVTVSGSTPAPTPPPTPGDKSFFTGDFNGDLFDTLAVQSGSTVTIYQNGEAWGIGLTLDTGWSVVGTGDFNGDNLDDFLRVNTEGYVVGEISNGNGTFTPQVLNLKNAGWDILGTGNFDGVGPDDVLIANPTAASETVGLLGYWKGGTEWTLINGYSPEWTMVSTGDFNGDGKCDMLWKNEFIGEGGLTYNAYCTWIVEDPVDWRMVSVANPKEWNFLCSGDFDGNGSHDIAMINNVGVVGIWGVTDGYLSSWSILSAVTSEWTLAGVADFNADGTDDIAWSNTDTGLTGYWQINNKELTTWSNIAMIS